MTSGKSRTRRLTARGAATRERIVAAAADLAFARGLGETSLDDVMERSGASKSQLYHYFADKDALIREATALQAQRVLGAQASLIGALDSLAAFERWRDAVLTLSQRTGCPLGALVYQLPPHARGAHTVVGDALETWRGLIEDGLAKMRACGELNPKADPADLALAVLAAVQGGLLLSRSARSNRPLERAFDMALAYIASHAAPEETTGDADQRRP